MATALDFSAAVPSPSAVKAAGHIGAVRYISPPRASWMNGKRISKAEVDAYKAHSLGTAAVWQYAAGTAQTSDVMRGYEGGKADALAGAAKLREVGLDGLPIFFACDFDINIAQWNGTARKYFKGACEAIGRERVGIYGHSKVCDWAREDGVIAPLADGKFLMWATEAWSGGKRPSQAVLFQRAGQKTVGGVECDINDVLYEKNWGHIPATKADEEELSMADVQRLEKKIDLLLDQEVGPGRDKNGNPTFSGWKQTNGKTRIDYDNERIDALEDKVDKILAYLEKK